MNWWTWALLASIITSLISLVGVLTIIPAKKIKNITTSLVAIAAGSLLGDAFIHLIPEMNEAEVENGGLIIIGGILVFFILEKILKWRHCHETECDDKKQIAQINLVADGIHNLIDGVAIGTAFAVDTEVGLATTLAIIFHEIPQEIGDFGVLIHSGMRVRTAIKWNLVSALISVLGVIIVMMVKVDGQMPAQLSGLVAGGFIYLATADLIPELHRHQSKLKQSMWQLLMVMMGVAIMLILGLME